MANEQKQQNNNQQQMISKLSFNLIKYDKSPNPTYNITIDDLGGIDIDFATELLNGIKDIIWKHNSKVISKKG